MTCIHPAFREWIETGSRDLTDPDDILCDLHGGLFPRLEYNQLELVEAIHPAQINEQGELQFTGGISFTLERVKGQCIELMERARRATQTKFPKSRLELKAVSGNEATYFYREGTRHFFLEGRVDDERIVDIDPSLKRIEPASSENYQVKGSLDLKDENEGPLLLPPYLTTPFIHLGDQMIHFGWHPFENRSLWSIQEPSQRARNLDFTATMATVAGVPQEVIEKMRKLDLKIRAATSHADSFEGLNVARRMFF